MAIEAVSDIQRAGTSAFAPGGGGGGGAVYGVATINLGSTPVSQAVVTITDAAIGATDYVEAFVMIDSTGDNTVDDHHHASASWKLACKPAAGEFDLYIDCLADLCWGTFKIRYAYA